MPLPNPWRFIKATFTPPRGRSERTTFSLGGRPIHGRQPAPPSEKTGKDRAQSGRPLSTSLEKNERLLKQVFHIPATSDVVFRNITCSVPRLKVTVAYVEGLAAFEKVFGSVLQPLMLLSPLRKGVERNPVKHLKDALLANGQVEEKATVEELIESIVAGDTVVLLQDRDRALVVETKGWEHRPVSEAVTERIVRGPQQGFVEVLRINTALVRSAVRSPDLIVEDISLGVRAKNRCALLYMDSLANEKAVAELRRRLNGIDTSEILTSGILEQFIESSHSLLPLIMSTERPDRAARYLMRGACAVLVSGDPFALILPVTLFTFLQSPEDDYVRWPYGNMIRAIRYIGFLLALYLPGLYVAVVNYHPEMIPTSLIMAIAASREPIPFPLSLEVILMYGSFELIREAGIRIPSPIGPTIGIVGALLIGEAAVAASIVSPILVIIISVTAVASFTLPNQELAMYTRLVTLIFLIAGATLGLLGIASVTYIMLCHASSLKSLGVPFLSPVTPRRAQSSYGVPVVPPWQAGKRPLELRPKDTTRQPPVARLWDKGEILKPSTRASALETGSPARGSQEGGQRGAGQPKQGTQASGSNRGSSPGEDGRHQDGTGKQPA